MRRARLKVLFTVSAAMLYSAFSLSATVLTIDNSGSEIFQQTQTNPCVIGDPACANPGGFGYSVIPSNTSPYDVVSPTYTVQQIRNLVGNYFIVGIDVNVAQLTHHLDLFTLAINGTVQFETPVGGADLTLYNNGNGYSDGLLRSFDLTPFAPTDTAVFHAMVSNADDGREEFFLIASEAEIPEPGTFALIGCGLSGLGIVGWRRRRRLR